MEIRMVVKSLKNRKFFITYTAIFSLFIILIVCISNLTVLKHSKDLLTEEIMTSNTKTLRQIQTFIDRSIGDDLNQIIYEDFMFYSKSSRMNQFFWPTTGHDILACYEDLSAKVNTRAYLYDILLYRKFDRAWISSVAGLTTYKVSPLSTAQDILKDTTTKSILSNPSPKMITTRDNTQNSLLFYSRTLPLFASTGERDGFILFKIDARAILSMLDEKFGPNLGQLLFFDSNGRLLINSGSENPLGKAFVNEQLAKEQGHLAHRISQDDYDLFWITITSLDWKLAMIIPSSALSYQTRFISQLTVSIIFIILCIGTLGTFLIMRHLYTPIQSLITKATKQTLHTPQHLQHQNEISMLHHAFDSISSEISTLRARVTDNQSLINYKILMELLLRKYNENKMSAKLNLLHPPFHYTQYCIILIDFHKSTFDQLTFMDQEMVTLKITDIVQDFSGDDCIFQTISHPPHRLITILNASDMKELLSPNNLDGLYTTLITKCSLLFNIAISHTCHQLEDIHTTYLSCIKLLDYQYLYGYLNIFDHTTTLLMSHGAKTVLEDLLPELENSLVRHHYSLAFKLVHSYRKVALNASYSQPQIKNHLLKFLDRLFIAAKINQHTLPETKAYYEKSIEESQWFHNDFLIILDLITCLKQAHGKCVVEEDNQFIHKIKNHISHHIMNQVTLYSVADEFDLTNTHLSKLFKKHTGVSFSSYLIELKLHHAALLLINSPHLKIGDIAESLGYVTPSYFTRIFKKKYGCTPEQYRIKYSDIEKETAIS